MSIPFKDFLCIEQAALRTSSFNPQFELPNDKVRRIMSISTDEEIVSENLHLSHNQPTTQQVGWHLGFSEDALSNEAFEWKHQMRALISQKPYGWGFFWVLPPEGCPLKQELPSAKILVLSHLLSSNVRDLLLPSC